MALELKQIPFHFLSKIPVRRRPRSTCLAVAGPAH
jgi:hypothetical protein